MIHQHVYFVWLLCFVVLLGLLVLVLVLLCGAQSPVATPREKLSRNFVVTRTQLMMSSFQR